MWKFLKSIRSFHYHVSLYISIIGIALGLIAWRLKAEDTVTLTFFWFFVFILIIVLIISIFLSATYGLHQKNEELQLQLREQKQGAIPRIQGFSEMPTFRLIASKSPLFIPNLDVAVILRGEIHPDSETFLCNGKIGHLHMSSDVMEVVLDTSSCDVESKSHLQQIFKDHNRRPRVFIIPGKISEQL